MHACVRVFVRKAVHWLIHTASSVQRTNEQTILIGGMAHRIAYVLCVVAGEWTSERTNGVNEWRTFNHLLKHRRHPSTHAAVFYQIYTTDHTQKYINININREQIQHIQYAHSTHSHSCWVEELNSNGIKCSTHATVNKRRRRQQQQPPMSSSSSRRSSTTERVKD